MANYAILLNAIDRDILEIRRIIDDYDEIILADGVSRESINTYIHKKFAEYDQNIIALLQALGLPSQDFIIRRNQQ